MLGYLKFQQEFCLQLTFPICAQFCLQYTGILVVRIIDKLPKKPTLYY